MADLARLGFVADPTPLAKAAKAMQDMVPAARAAQTAVDGLNSSTTKYEGPVGAIAAAAKRAGVSVEDMKTRVTAAGQSIGQQSATMKRLTSEYDQLDKAHRQTVAGATNAGKAIQGLSFDAKNLSYQLVDVGQGLMSGQPLFQIFAQQAGQIGQIAATSEKGIKGLFVEIGSGIAKVLTPMRLLTAGVIAIGVAITAAVLSWKNYALQLDDVRRLADTSSKAMSGLNNAAAVKGISDDEFFSGMRAFSQNVYDARNNLGSMVTLLRANGVTATSTEATFGKIADLVKNARNDVQRMNILQAAGLPTTRQWIDFMSQGSAKIQLIASGMRSLGGPDNDRLIEAAKKFDDKWNEIWRNISLGIKSFGLTAITKFEEFYALIDKIAKSEFFTSVWTKLATVIESSQLFVLAKTLGTLYGLASSSVKAVSNFVNPSSATPAPSANRSDVANSRVSGAFDTLAAFEKSRTKATVDDAALKKRMADEQQRISMLGDLASVEDLVKSKQLELDSTWLSGGPSVGKYKDAVLNAVRAQAEMSRVQQQASIGVFDLDKANKAAADTLQMWIQKGLLDPTNANQMAAAMNVLKKNTRDMADAASVAGSNLPQLQQALNDASNVNKQIDQFATSSFNSITTGLADIFDGTKSAAQGFADLGKTVLRSLEEMLIKMYIVMPIFNALKGVLGGGGLLGSILPGIGGTAAAVHHGGGVAGSGNVMRSVDPAVFIGARRYHTGGVAGLAPDEVPAILQRGERITPRGAGNDNTPIINIVGGGINPQDVEIRQTEDGRGNTRTDIVLDQAVANAMSRSGSNTRRAMANNYGAKPIGVRR